MAAVATSTSVARQVRQRVLGSHDQLWRIEDFDGSPKAVNSELRRLVERGELHRVRRGMYWRGRRTSFGMIGVDAGQALLKAVGHEEAVGATGWNATNLLGLSTQVPAVASLAVTHRAPQGLDRVRVASRAARSGRRRARLTGLEVTLLEALEGWDRYVEADPGTALARFSEIVARNDVRIPRLVQASATEPAAVRERLRAVLVHAGHADEANAIPPARDPRTRAKALRVLQGAA
ncbi:MAG: DUF6088 family protein [Actinomycetota bacterium]